MVLIEQYANDRGPGRGVQETKPPWRWNAFFGHSVEAANSPAFLIFRDTKGHSYLQSAWSKIIFPDFSKIIFFPWQHKFPDIFQFFLTCRNPGNYFYLHSPICLCAVSQGGREVNDFIKYLAREATDELSGYSRDGKKKKSKKTELWFYISLEGNICTFLQLTGLRAQFFFVSFNNVIHRIFSVFRYTVSSLPWNLWRGCCAFLSLVYWLLFTSDCCAAVI